MAYPIAFLSTEIITGIVALLAAGGAALLWLLKFRKKPADGVAPAAGPAPALAADVRRVLREADRTLAQASRTKGRSLKDHPIYLVVGAAGSGKTSLIRRCGLEPRLLAGEVGNDAEPKATAVLNAWLAADSVFIELGARVIADRKATAAVFRHLRTGVMASAAGRRQPPRGMVVCFERSTIAADASPDDAAAAGRALNEFLCSAADLMGTSLPVYTVCTKLDEAAGFEEAVSNLTEGEASQALGRAISSFDATDRGTYRDETSDLVRLSFRDLVYALCDKRLTLLPREHNQARMAGAYQFPREFYKLERSLVPFLVELARPSPLQLSPVLRGFYFTGCRKRLLAAAPAPTTRADERDFGASVLFRRGTEAAGTPAGGGANVTDWLFVRRLFRDVVLHDEAAQVATRVSSRTATLRAAGLAFAGGLALFVLVMLTVSYARNRALEVTLSEAAASVLENVRQGRRMDPPALEQLRAPVAQVVKYQDGAPFSMRWGLYRSELLLLADSAYCRPIRASLVDGLAARMAARLNNLRGQTPDYAGGYRTLKSYLMMVSRPDRTLPAFLADELLAQSTGGGATNADGRLVRDQLETYAALLAANGPHSSCLVPEASGAVASARSFLQRLDDTERLYNALLETADRAAEQVNYNRLYPNNAVSDAQVVRGAFTRQGWAAMQQLLLKPQESLQSDAWVLGQDRGPAADQVPQRAAQIRARYTADYIGAWRGFLSKAVISEYHDVPDAVGKLDKMSGNRSVLLSLLALISEHTGVNEEAKAAFQPAAAVAPALNNFEPAGGYLEQLAMLKNRLSRSTESAGPARDQDALEVGRVATTARDTVDKLGRGFRGQTDQAVKDFLLKPITQIDAVLTRQSAADLNGAGQGLCRQANAVFLRFPFNPSSQTDASVQEVQELLQPGSGQLWQFYNQQLRDSLELVGSTYELRANPKYKLSRGFIEFFNFMAQLSQTLFGAGGPEPLLQLQVRWLPSAGLRRLDVTIDENRVSLGPAVSDRANLTWNPRQSQRLRVDGVFDSLDGMQYLQAATGPWALLRWLAAAEPSRASNGLQWVSRDGNSSRLLPTGGPMTYRLEVRLGGTQQLFDRQMLRSRACVVPVSP
jgi:type VI secretion system protein ImpL